MKPPLYAVFILLATASREGRCISNRNINRRDFFVQGSPPAQPSRSSERSACNVATPQPLAHRYLWVRGGKTGTNPEELGTGAGRSGNDEGRRLTGRTRGAGVGTRADAGAGAYEDDSSGDTRAGSIVPPTSSAPASTGGGGGSSGGSAVGISGGAGTTNKAVVMDAQEEALRTALLQAHGPSK